MYRIYQPVDPGKPFESMAQVAELDAQPDPAALPANTVVERDLPEGGTTIMFDNRQGG